MKPQHKPETDILIIGSGISGLMCALKAAETYHVTILTKKKLATTATAMAQGGIAAAQENSDDGMREHEEDTLIAGEHHNQKQAVQHVIRHAPNMIKILREYGVEFDSELTLEGGHRKKRIHHTKDTTGKTIEDALIKAVKKQKNITIIEDAMTLELLGDTKACRGCQYLKDATIYTIQSAYTVLATGGAGQVYAHTTNPKVATGDGIAMAHRLGATISDMEFIQFHPTALLDRYNPHVLLSESLRGEGAMLRNAKGEAFMKQYDPRGDLAPRDKVSQAIFIEQKKGKVFLDISHKPAAWIRERFPAIYPAVLKRTKQDMTKEPVAITPVAHYLCGGVEVNTRGETSVPHLYAIGETARTGLHGANRLASNSLLEGAVYGIKAAEDILQKLSTKEKLPSGSAKKTSFSIASQPFAMKHVRQQIQDTMWTLAGIHRTQADLSKALFQLQRIRDILPPIHMVNEEIMEARNLLEVSLLIVKAAQKRKKSLGCHWIK